MKRLFRSLPLLFVLTAAAFFIAPVNQAEAGWWTWKRYRMKFWLPRGMRVTKNTRYALIAKGKGIVLKISAWKSRRGTSISAAKYGYRTYRVIRNKRILVRKRLSGKRSYRGGKTWRYLYMGSGRYRRSSVYWAVIGMANHRMSNKFYVRMWWKKWRHTWVKPRVRKIARRIYNY